MQSNRTADAYIIEKIDSLSKQYQYDREQAQSHREELNKQFNLTQNLLIEHITETKEFRAALSQQAIVTGNMLKELHGKDGVCETIAAHKENLKNTQLAFVKHEEKNTEEHKEIREEHKHGWGIFISVSVLVSGAFMWVIDHFKK